MFAFLDFHLVEPYIKFFSSTVLKFFLFLVAFAKSAIFIAIAHTEGYWFKQTPDTKY